jgi:hypothetical protein
MGGLFYLAASISHGHGKTAIAHHSKIEYVVPDEGNFAGAKSFRAENFAKGFQLVPNALVDLLHLRSRARKATVSELRRVMSPALMPAMRAIEMPAPS